MKTETFYRKANVSKAEAVQELMDRFPNAKVENIEVKEASAEEARTARAKEGDLVFEATVKMAEFPPVEKEKEEGAPPEEEAPEAPEEPSESEESEDSEDSGDSEAPDVPDFAGGDEDEGDKMSPEEETNHLLKQILDALQHGGGPDDLGPPVDDGLGLPDIGAPPQGEGLGGPPQKAPLPPPVKKAPPMGGPSFAKFNPNTNTVTLVRQDVDGQVGNTDLITEAAKLWPTHKVARIRRSGVAEINGSKVNLPENKLAVVTLEKK